MASSFFKVVYPGVDDRFTFVVKVLYELSLGRINAANSEAVEFFVLLIFDLFDIESSQSDDARKLGALTVAVCQESIISKNMIPLLHKACSATLF